MNEEVKVKKEGRNFDVSAAEMDALLRLREVKGPNVDLGPVIMSLVDKTTRDYEKPKEFSSVPAEDGRVPDGDDDGETKCFYVGPDDIKPLLDGDDVSRVLECIKEDTPLHCGIPVVNGNVPEVSRPTKISSTPPASKTTSSNPPPYRSEKTPIPAFRPTGIAPIPLVIPVPVPTAVPAVKGTKLGVGTSSSAPPKRDTTSSPPPPAQLASAPTVDFPESDSSQFRGDDKGGSGMAAGVRNLPTPGDNPWSGGGSFYQDMTGEDDNDQDELMETMVKDPDKKPSKSPLPRVLPTSTKKRSAIVAAFWERMAQFRSQGKALPVILGIIFSLILLIILVETCSSVKQPDFVGFDGNTYSSDDPEAEPDRDQRGDKNYVAMTPVGPDASVSAVTDPKPESTPKVDAGVVDQAAFVEKVAEIGEPKDAAHWDTDRPAEKVKQPTTPVYPKGFDCGTIKDALQQNRCWVQQLNM